MLVIALIIISAIVMTPAGVMLLKRAIIGRRRAGVKCYNCGFDLVGSRGVTERCPECAAVIVAPGRRPPMARRTRVKFAMLALILLQPSFYMGLIGWEMIRSTPVYAWLFPDSVLRRTPRTPMEADSAQQAASARFRAYPGGGVSSAELDSALRAYMNYLNTPGMTLFPVKPGTESGLRSTHLIASGRGFRAASDLAAILDDKSIPDERYSALIDAVANAYERSPISASTNVDDVLCDLLMGARSKRYGGGTGDYEPTGAPRQLGAAERNRLVRMILTIQGDSQRMWNWRWGEGFENAAAVGNVDRTDVDLYLDQVFSPRIVIPEGTKLERGDVVRFYVHPSWRNGAGMPVRVRLVGASPPLRERVAGDIVAGQLFLTAEGSVTYGGFLFLPDVTGKLTIDLDLEADFGPGIAHAQEHVYSGPHDNTLSRRLPAHKSRKRARLEVELIDSTSPRTVDDDAGITPEQMKRHFGATIRCEGGGDGTTVWGSISARGLTIDTAFDIAIRQGEREYPMGWVLVQRIGDEWTQFSGPAPGFDPARSFELLLRSDKGPIERAAWIPRIWKGQLVLTDVWVRND